MILHEKVQYELKYVERNKQVSGKNETFFNEKKSTHLMTQHVLETSLNFYSYLHVRIMLCWSDNELKLKAYQKCCNCPLKKCP